MGSNKNFPGDQAARIIASALGGKTSGEGWTARCPAHDDKNPSLSIKQSASGRVLIHCHAGCSQYDVIAALKEKGLWQEGRRSSPSYSSATEQPQGCTLQVYAKKKELSTNFLQSIGLRQITYLGVPAVRIPYYHPDGSEYAVRYRTGINGNRFRWKKGSKPSLYGLSRLGNPDYVVLVEGESDVQTLWYHDIPSLGLPGANTWREDRDARHLDGINRIYVLIEPDQGGKAVLKWLGTSSIRDRVHLVTLGQYKDPSDLHLDEPRLFPERFEKALQEATPWATHIAGVQSKQEKEAWDVCKNLAMEPDILNRVATDIERYGVVGERRATKLLYLVLVSRFLSKPVSAVIKGPSSGGKSYTLESVLAFFPKSAQYTLTSMSAKALVYSDEPLQNRFLVIYEMSGLASDFLSYSLRTLISEGHLCYETVEKGEDGRFQTRTVKRDGPTGLLITTTATRLHPENETRMFSIPVIDTQEQTRHVLRAIARRRSDVVELELWHTLQLWLEVAEHRVKIPFAEKLADLIPPVAIRLRRDFGAILALIRSHAILHQATRERDETGQIIAILYDYEGVRNLVSDIISDGVGVSVSVNIRETVEAVKSQLATGEAFISAKLVAKRLGLDKSTASRRIVVAIDAGYLRNEENRQGRPMRLTLGDALPEDLTILPLPAALESCTVAATTEEQAPTHRSP